FRRDTAIGRMPVLISIDDLNGIVHVRGDTLDERDLILDRHRVGDRQRRRVSRARAHAADRPAARLNPDEVVAEIVELLLHACLSGLTDRDDANHGGDADRASEYRPNAPHLVSEQRHQGGSKQACVIHGLCARSNPGTAVMIPGRLSSSGQTHWSVPCIPSRCLQLVLATAFILPRQYYARESASLMVLE